MAKIAKYTQREWGTAQKKKYMGQIRECFKQLCHAPALGTSRDDIDQGLRSHPVEKHTVLYRETKNALRIVRVLHQSMDAERHIS